MKHAPTKSSVQSMQTHVYTRRCTYKTTETSIKDMQSAPQLQFTDKLAGSKINDDGSSDDGDDDNAMNSSDDELLYNAAQAYEESVRRPSPQTDGDVIASDDGVDRTEQEQTTQPPPTGWYTAFTKRFKVC